MTPPRIVIVSGFTAAGKTTHCRLLATALGWRYVSMSRIRRSCVIGSSSSQEEWLPAGDRLRSANTALDREMDRRLAELIEGRVVRLDRSVVCVSASPGGHRSMARQCSAVSRSDSVRPRSSPLRHPADRPAAARLPHRPLRPVRRLPLPRKRGLSRLPRGLTTVRRRAALGGAGRRWAT